MFSGLKIKDGQLITDKSWIKDQWKRYCEQLMNNDDDQHNRVAMTTDYTTRTAYPERRNNSCNEKTKE